MPTKSLRVDADTHGFLKALAALDRRPLSDLLGDAVGAYLAKRAGEIGALRARLDGSRSSRRVDAPASTQTSAVAPRTKVRSRGGDTKVPRDKK
jgi:hypothetical protein